MSRLYQVMFSDYCFYSLLGMMLMLFLTACSEPSTNTSMNHLLSGDATGYAQVVSGNEFSFPGDHLSHPDFRQEWWYLTVNLKTEKGQNLGLQWTQFRIALSPEDKDLFTDNDWATNQLYLAHTALTTESLHVAEEKWSRQHPKLANVQAEPLTIKLDNWQWQSLNNDLFPASLTVATEDFSYRLSLNSDNPIQLQGEQGYSRKSADGEVASYYYSQPFIQVDGDIELKGEAHKVSGTGWFDREWSSQFLSKSQQGWDWFALKLNDGSALMVFQLRASSIEQLSFLSARRMYPDGTGRNIASSQIEMIPMELQPIDNNFYPVSWQIKIPSEQIDIKVSALNAKAKMPLTIPYWEGPIHFIGSHTGDGYMELTGY